jgi:pyruvate-formate lyase-activating enzyme
VQTRAAHSPAAVYARADGSVCDLPGIAAAADGGCIVPAAARDFIPLPEGTRLLTLPGRNVVGYDRGRRVTIDRMEGRPVNAVAAALPLGYTRTLLPAFEERSDHPVLPLFGYTAVAWNGHRLCAAAIKTDALESWSPQAHEPARLRAGITALAKEFPGNQIVAQLARCATEYGCFTAQNVFLRSGEGALPVSPACNARCLGCISKLEPDAGTRSAQERIDALPSVEDIVAVAAAHLEAVPAGMVSFGQGCEGEPLLAAPRIAAAIRAIRTRTAKGVIHCNTNASRPRALAALFEVGLQSVRVSLNSAREEVYRAYYRPRGYAFADVLEGLRIAVRYGASISLNLLTHPGITDDAAEMAAFGALLRSIPVAMVQTRTLNIDPAQYFAAVGRPKSAPLGMRTWLRRMQAEFPNIRFGNFTRGFG